MRALLMFSCNEKPKMLKPVSSTIKGPLNGCFEVVLKDYQIIGNHVNVEFLRTNDCQIEPQVVAEFLDDFGTVVATSSVDVTSNQDDFKFLLANKVGESSAVAFAVGNSSPTQVRFSSSLLGMEDNEIQEETLEAEELLEDTLEQEFDIVSEEVIKVEEEAVEIIEDEEDENEDIIEDTPTQSVSSSSNKDWDKILDDFESYVDHYISLLKKASSGNLSAMTDYAIALEKAEKLEKDLNAAQDEMTNAQMKRYLRITKKMTDAAYDMYDKMY